MPVCGKTDDQVRVRESSGVWNRRGQIGTVISSYSNEVDVKFSDSQTRYTFRCDEVERVTAHKFEEGDQVTVKVERVTAHKFEEGDQVTVKRGKRAGQRAVISEIRPKAARLLFADDEVLLYGLGEIEPATMPMLSEGDYVRHRGERFQIKERCPNSPGRWHLSDRKDPDVITRCGHQRDIELVSKGTVPLESYLDRKVRIRKSWASHAGQVGVVKTVFPDSALTRVAFDDGKLHTYHREHLELLDEEQGEEVMVTAGHSKWYGRVGKIEQRMPTGMVKISGIPYPIHEQHLRFTTPATEAKEPQPVRLVGLTGRKQAGKDTFAARLIEQHGFTRMAFADNVRQVALAIDPIVAWKNAGEEVRLSAVVDLVGWELAKALPEVRRLLQRIGTEGIRSLDPEFWVRQVVDKLPDGPVVITDVRFSNEADAIKKAGGIIVRVVRTGQPKDDQHSSESSMDTYEVDFAAVNNGTVEQFRQRVDRMVADGLLRPRS